MKITKRQLKQIIKEEFRSREGKRLTRARYDELTDELDDLYAKLEKAKMMEEPKRSAYLQFYQNAINSLQGHLARVRAEGLSESRTIRITKRRLIQVIRETLDLEEDVRKRGDEWCAYVDDKLTKAEKENNPKKYKGKKVGSIQRTKSGKPRMKARACYGSKKKANNAMAAAMMG